MIVLIKTGQVYFRLYITMSQ